MLVTTRDGSKSITLNGKVRGSRVLVNGSAILDTLPDDPTHLLAELRDDDGNLSVYRVDVRDGTRQQIERGGPRVIGYGTNRKGEVVTRIKSAGHESLISNAFTILEARAPGESDWSKLFEVHPKEYRAFADVEFIAATDDPKKILVLAYPDGGQGDARAVRLFDVDSKTLGPVIFNTKTFDVDSVILNTRSREFAAGCYWTDVEVCEFKDKALQADWDGLTRVFKGERTFTVSSFADDDSRWVVHAQGPADPGTFYVYNRKAKTLDVLGQVSPALDSASLGHTRRFDFKTRDGVDLSGYLTLPPMAPGAHPPPLIVLPHGGPEVRDALDFNVWVQYLASRGYAVLQPNYRGSSGFGRAFAQAGYGEWGGRIVEDIEDSLKAAIASGQVDPKRVCIVGGSYGGYAALYEAATRSETYKCAVSVDGIADLNEDISWDRRVYGEDSDAYRYLSKAEGNPNKDGAAMAAKSPIRLTKSWTVPTLLIHGDADDNVYVEQSRGMHRALEAAHVTVRYDEIKDMGHGPGTRKEWTRVLTEIGDFVDQYIGPNSKP